MDRQEFEDKLDDAISSVLTDGFYEEDLGLLTVKIDYREDNEEDNGKHS